MDNTNLVLVKTDDAGELYTPEQLAKEFDLTVDGMRKRIVALGLKPVREAKTGPTGYPALYSKDAMIKIQQQQQQSILIEKQRSAGAKCAEGMSLVGRKAFVQVTFDELTLEEQMAFTIENQVAMMQRLKDALHQVEEEKEVLEITNDLSSNYLPAIRTTAEKVSQFEHGILKEKAIELGWDEGEVLYGEPVELKRYTRIQVKSTNDKYPAWAYHRDVWTAFGHSEVQKN